MVRLHHNKFGDLGLDVASPRRKVQTPGCDGFKLISMPFAIFVDREHVLPKFHATMARQVKYLVPLCD
jgi:hypothetical protein